MSNIILIIGIGTIAILIVKAIELFEDRLFHRLRQMHKDIRRNIELGFWNQRRSREILRFTRRKR